MSGYSGSGKTTLVERIVGALVGSGYRVATLKSSMHAKGEEEGSDTWRHRQAGSSFTIFIDQSKPADSSADLARLLKDAEGGDVDFLIIEGMKSSPFPKVWCLGDSDDLEDLPTNTMAVVTWKKSNEVERPSVPVFHTGQLNLILDLVMREATDI